MNKDRPPTTRLPPTMSYKNAGIAAYCVGAALFFGACAYAQLNDPDPWLWVVGYLGGGVFLNGGVLLVLLNCGETTMGRQPLSFMVLVFVVGISGILLYMVASLFLTSSTISSSTYLHGEESSSSFGTWLWSILELEEGREIAGLMILLLHVLRLGAFLRDTKNNNNDNKKVSDATSTSSSNTSSALATMGLTCLLCGAVYLWVYYQPEMNARYKTEHCSGQFHDPLLPEEL